MKRKLFLFFFQSMRKKKSNSNILKQSFQLNILNAKARNKVNCDSLPPRLSKSTVKLLKSWKPEKICCNYPKIWTWWLYCTVMRPKRCRWNGKQCRHTSDCSTRSSLIWVYTVCPALSVWKFRIIVVTQLSGSALFMSSTFPKFSMFTR